MPDDDVKFAAELLHASDSTQRTRGARRLMGMCCIDNRAREVVQTEGLLDTVFSLAKSDDPGKEKDGAYVLLSLFDDVRDELIKHSDYPFVAAKLAKSPDVIVRSVGRQLRNGLAKANSNRTFSSRPSMPGPAPGAA